MRRFVALAALALAACGSQTVAGSKCGVTDAQLSAAIEDVADMAPYTGKRLGRCELIVDEGHNVSVITPEIQRAVDDMMAREKVEKK